MGTKWTPGPWTVDEQRTQCGRAFRIGTGEMLEAGKGCCIIYDDYPGNPDNERAANARLIAAAPTMHGHIEASTGDLTRLRVAIEAGDPKRELLIRVDDMMRRAKAALQAQEAERT